MFDPEVPLVNPIFLIKDFDSVMFPWIVEAAAIWGRWRGAKNAPGPGSPPSPSPSWNGNLWVVVTVKTWVNEQADSWLAALEWTTNQKSGQQGDPTLDNDFNS